DGPVEESESQFEQVKVICDRHGCTRLHIAGSPEERASIWRGRKAAFAAVGRISPDYFVQDGVVPRTRLAEVLDRIAGMGDEAGLRVANVFHAGDVVSDIVAAGIVPAAVEMMDTLAIEAAEEAVHAGYTVGVAAALVVELDGPTQECDVQFEQVKKICDAHGCTRLHIAGSAEERAAIWRGRKSAFAAVGRISPDYFVQDGVVPRTRLAEVLSRIAEMGDEQGLRVANVFHAGDGNLHPLVLYSAAAEETERAEKLSGQIAELCVELGGSLSGEHGIGTDKACSMPKMFSEDDLAVMHRVRLAFDPDGLCNPGKVLPTPRLCGERPGKYRPHALEEAGVIERL
ncbi:MAG TPA: FAD-linked oxidase C-terminal domain-containing protein, partial [Pseudonocardia sp.]|nr:FAD-linked oxidase C-terminal domain-containing protein [Pseudonocardia sp.]